MEFEIKVAELCSTENSIQALNHELEISNSLGDTLGYYDSGLINMSSGNKTRHENSLEIAYVSDLHILHNAHNNYGDDINKAIRCISKSLFESLINYKKEYRDFTAKRIILFVGDICSNPTISIRFYNQFILQYKRLYFKKYVSQINEVLELKQRVENKEIRQKRNSNLAEYIKRLKADFYNKTNFVIDVFEKYCERYSYGSYEYAFSKFINTKQYVKMNISINEDEILKFLVKIESLEYNLKWNKERLELDLLKWEYYSDNDISRPSTQHLLNTYKEFILTRESQLCDDIYAVLGNHEYINFPNVNSAVSFYKSELEKIGINLLFNEYHIDESNKYLIYGGTGFAKYNAEYNADVVVCCKNFSRVDEKQETEEFERRYYDALEQARSKDLCMISLSHYPISDCLNNRFDKDVIYFTGHNHRNEYCRNPQKTLYADNQIGYNNTHFNMKIALTGCFSNPYGSIGDGLYKTTVNEYLAFYRYIGEHIGEGKLLLNMCSNGADIYVAKRKDYYGFFIIKPNGSSKGISIINGGKTKKITHSVDLDWLCENFETILLKYLKMLTPMRLAQEELSRELKALGFAGTIHGTIVDIDFYHHIMINPFDGTMLFYYSPFWGEIEKLDTFNDVMNSMFKISSNRVESQYRLCMKKHSELLCNDSYLLGYESNRCLLGDVNNYGLESVSRSNGMYEISRNISPLQRLFSGHVLRSFDVQLAETKPQAYRKLSYVGRFFMLDRSKYKIVSDDLGDELLAIKIIEDILNNYHSDNELAVSENPTKFNLNELKKRFKKDPYFSGWINEYDYSILGTFELSDFDKSKHDYLATCLCGRTRRLRYIDIKENNIPICSCGIKNRSTYVGYTQMMKCNIIATITEYDSKTKRCTVEFKDGLIKHNVAFQTFERRIVNHTQDKK